MRRPVGPSHTPALLGVPMTSLAPASLRLPGDTARTRTSPSPLTARDAIGVRTAFCGAKSERNPARPGWMARPDATAFPQLRWVVAGPGFEPGWA